MQISVLLRAVNIRRRIKLTWKVRERGGKEETEREKGQITLRLALDGASGCEPSLYHPIVTRTRGEYLSPQTKSKSEQLVGGYHRQAAPSRGSRRTAPKLELPSGTGTKPT